MLPQTRLEDDIKTAMKERQADKLSTLRLLLGAVKNRKIELGTDLDDAEFLALVQKAIKQRRDAAEQYAKGGRDELAAKEEAEIGVLEAYLPEQASEDDIRAAIAQLIASEGLEGPKAMGPVMKAMKEKFGGATDGQTLSRLARELLA